MVIFTRHRVHFIQAVWGKNEEEKTAELDDEKEEILRQQAITLKHPPVN